MRRTAAPTVGSITPPVGPAGGVERLEQGGRHGHPLPRGGVHPRELRVIAEPAAPDVDPRQLRLQRRAGGAECAGVGHRELSGRAERGEPHRFDRRGHDAPERTIGTCWTGTGAWSGAWNPPPAVGSAAGALAPPLVTVPLPPVAAGADADRPGAAL